MFRFGSCHIKWYVGNHFVIIIYFFRKNRRPQQNSTKRKHLNHFLVQLVLIHQEIVIRSAAILHCFFHFKAFHYLITHKRINQGFRVDPRRGVLLTEWLFNFEQYTKSFENAQDIVQLHRHNNYDDITIILSLSSKK